MVAAENGDMKPEIDDGGAPDAVEPSESEEFDLFDRNGLFPEDAWQRQYQAVEKTPRIRDIETMPRPDA